MAATRVTRSVRFRQWNDVANQAYVREHVFIYGTHRLQVRIEHNANQSQSVAIIKRWSGARWERITSIPPQHMTTARLVYSPEISHQDQLWTKCFDEMELELSDQAMLIVGE